MSVKIEYKKQVDAFCDAKRRVTATELLSLAEEKGAEDKTRSVERGTVIDFTEKRNRRTVWKKVLSAACILIVLSLAATTTALAATGRLGELFRKIFKDETTAGLVEEGFFHEINQSATEGIFRVDLMAVAGDINTPKLVFEVYVDDKNLTSCNDRICLSAYTLGEEQYENELDLYTTFDSWGVKDETIDNLYHVSFDGASAWISHGEPVVVSVREIRFEHVAQPYFVNLEYRFALPQGGLHPIIQEYYGGVRLPSGEGDYYLNYAEFGEYDSRCSFMFPYDGISLEGQYATPLGLEALLQMQWDSFETGLTLVVDGVEYGMCSEGKCTIYRDETGEAGPPGWYHGWVMFPAVNATAAEEIYLKQGENRLRIK